MTEQMVCPRCGGSEFTEHDCGSDDWEGYGYSSERCKACGLWHDGWQDKWFVGVETCRDVEDAEVFAPPAEPAAPARGA